MDPKKIVALVIVGVLLIGGLLLSGSILENVDADQIMVVQSPVSGDLTWHITPGIKWQGFGKVTYYPRRSIYDFDAKSGGVSLKIRFNDAGHGDMSGSIQWEMPLDIEHLTALHTRFGSGDAIQAQLVKTVVDKAVYMTGPLMSSRESYAERRNELINFVFDQVENGVYRSTQREAKVFDPITGEEKTKTVAEIVMKNGVPERQEAGQLTQFGIRTFNFAINTIDYDERVESQIQEQQKLAMGVQTSIAQAKEAEQRRITTEESGKADAAKAKWDQEVIKAKEVTAAEQRLAVAELNTQTAEQYKLAQILEGEGEATKKRLIMQADGALEPKLAAAVEINKAYADAIRNYAGNWSPSVVMGQQQGGAGIPGGAAMPLIELLTAKTARDLGIDLSIAGAAKTKSDGANKP